MKVGGDFIPQPAFGCMSPKYVFSYLSNFSFSLFLFTFFFQKMWNQHLDCAAPKRWSKYTTCTSFWFECVAVGKSLSIKLLTFLNIKLLSSKIFFIFRSEDDPFVLIAALACGPNTMFLTNDTLRQHFGLLRDSTEMRLFTRYSCYNYVTWSSEWAAVSRGKGHSCRA